MLGRAVQQSGVVQVLVHLFEGSCRGTVGAEQGMEEAVRAGGP